MGLATFKGGVHPYEGKELSEHKPVQVLMPKGELVYPMSQHIGAPAAPLVKKGDKVSLVGFGTFEVKERAAKEGINPRTKEKMPIPASKRPAFKAGKALKDAVSK